MSPPYLAISLPSRSAYLHDEAEQRGAWLLRHLSLRVLREHYGAILFLYEGKVAVLVIEIYDRDHRWSCNII